ncbi:WD40-repeat containing protein [Chondrus crispus]|uniref:WD40-repeat containing protein n=1 Tax=Chondrus crispus TaxID=2769 RepID=R7Q3R3_CHOCR|nr:WD40-repeat containing protein [Chondrus crispus]CDF32125.1 WD40-repeat containing protein [Chondrus crispus]|eukprot:XP_005711790.1 WD40-repeat containing protein [Chondrus crispus]
MVGSAAFADRLGATSRRDERVSYILREPETRHRFGISALVFAKDQLFTAGRDGTVRSWEIPAPPYRRPAADIPVAGAVRTFDEHVDWVNDVVLVDQFERLVSCSSDTTLKVWNMNDARRSLRTLVEHTDYVKALAVVPSGVASGSLDGRVLVWDLVTGSLRLECGVDLEEGQQRNGSVYCMSASVEGNVLVSGSTDKTISVWDVRTGDRVVHLRGHSDSVRCLTMKHDGRMMLSGGSDSTVKLWDLRQERCVRSFDSYADSSVWAVASNYEFDSFVSGGRDGSVWHTDIAADVASLVVEVADSDVRSNMVLDVALTPCNSAVWVSTTGSTVRLWPLPQEATGRMTDSDDASNAAGANVPTVQEKPADLEADIALQRPADVHTDRPLCLIPGLPGIIAQKIMNDRRHVLTCDTQGEYCIWDITRGVLEKSLGIIEDRDIDEVAKSQDKEVCIPSWFQVDIRLGSLSVRLDKSNAANAEIYAVDAGLDADTEEVKVNIGEHVVRALFRKWHEEYKKRISNGEESMDLRARSPPTNAQKNAADRANNLPPYSLPSHIPVIVTEDQSPVPILRRVVGSFQGNEQEVMPGWVLDLIRDGKGQVREAVKVSFGLEPEDGTGLPLLKPTTLTAPRVLRVKKVAAYIAREFKEQNTGVNVNQEHLEVLCNGKVLPSYMSLAAVRQFRWRSPDDLKLSFRLKPGVQAV